MTLEDVKVRAEQIHQENTNTLFLCSLPFLTISSCIEKSRREVD